MHRSRLLIAGLVVFAAACSSDNTSNPTASDDATITADVAGIAADGVAEDVDVMTGMDGNIGNTGNLSTDNFVSGNYRPGLTGCSFLNGSFTCPPVLKNGLTVTRIITFLDGSGASQVNYDDQLTASIHVIADISGDRTHGPWSATVTRHRDFTISGLLGSETTRTVNGTGNENVSRSRVTKNDSTRSYTVVGTSLIADVVLPVRPDGGNGWPISGTITRNLTITVTSGLNTGKTVTRTVVITFNGSSTPSGLIDGRSFTFDCNSHTATPH